MKYRRIQNLFFLYSLSIYFNCSTGDPYPKAFISNSIGDSQLPAFSRIKNNTPHTWKISTSQNSKLNQAIIFDSETNLPKVLRDDRSISNNSPNKQNAAVSNASNHSKTISKGRAVMGRSWKHGYRLVSKRKRIRGRVIDGTSRSDEVSTEKPGDETTSTSDPEGGTDEDNKTTEKPDNNYCSTDDNKANDNTDCNTEGYKTTEASVNTDCSTDDADCTKGDNNNKGSEDKAIKISHKSAKNLCQALERESGSSKKRSYLWAPIEQYAPALGRGFPLMPPLFNPECLKWELKRCHGTVRFPLMTPCTFWAPMPLRTQECFQHPKSLEVYVRGRPKEYKQGNCPCIWPCNSFFDPIQRCRTDEKIDLETWYDKFDSSGNSNNSYRIPHYNALQLCHGMKPIMNKENPIQINSIPIRIQSLSGAPPDENNKCMIWRYKSCNDDSLVEPEESFEEQDEGSLGWNLDENVTFFHNDTEQDESDSSEYVKPEGDGNLGWNLDENVIYFKNSTSDEAEDKPAGRDLSKNSAKHEPSDSVEQDETDSDESGEKKSDEDSSEKKSGEDSKESKEKKSEEDSKEKTSGEDSKESKEKKSGEDSSEKKSGEDSKEKKSGEENLSKEELSNNYVSSEEKVSNQDSIEEKPHKHSSASDSSEEVIYGKGSSSDSGSNSKESKSNEKHEIVQLIANDAVETESGDRVKLKRRHRKPKPKSNSLKRRKRRKKRAIIEGKGSLVIHRSIPLQSKQDAIPIPEIKCGVWVKVHDEKCIPETPAKPHEADETSKRETKSVPFGAAPRSEDQPIVEKILECAGGFPCFLGEKKRTRRGVKFEYKDSNSNEFYFRNERALHQLQKTSSQNNHKGRTSANSKYSLKGRTMLETEGLMKLSQMTKIEKGSDCKCDWPCLPFFDPINKCYNENGDLLVDENNKPIMLPRQLNKDQRHLVQCLSYLEEDDIDCNIKQ